MDDGPHKTRRRTGKTGGRKARGDASEAPSQVWIYGRHAVKAALSNPDRRIRQILATKNASIWLGGQEILEKWRTKIEDAKPDAIDNTLPKGAVHQGLAVQAYDLPRVRLKEACSPPVLKEPVVVLDQITDPQNIAAIFRSAAAFGAKAVIVQDRRTPPLAGALAKAAAGAIETVPCVKVVNIARSLEALSNLGYLTAGLAGEAQEDIRALPDNKPLALVFGAEGSGLRKLVRETCERQVRIPITPAIESLNVSTAAAIALYEAAGK